MSPIDERYVAAILSADNGIAKMRTVILRLAVRGGFSGTAPVPAEGASLPPGWRMSLLRDCVDVLDARRQPVNEDERSKRIARKRPGDLYPYFGATRQQGWIDEYLFDEELVLLGEDGAPFLDPHRSKAYVVSGKTWVNNHAHVLRGRGIDNRFLSYVLNVTDYAGRATGTTRLKLTQGKMLDIPVPVPPLADQKRVVDKIERLFAVCSELEQLETAKREIADRLAGAALSFLAFNGTNDGALRRASGTR